MEDLRQAVKLSPESEKDVIREKLAEAKQKLRQEAQGGHGRAGQGRTVCREGLGQGWGGAGRQGAA